MFTGYNVPGLMRGWESVYVHLQYSNSCFNLYSYKILWREWHHSTIPRPVLLNVLGIKHTSGCSQNLEFSPAEWAFTAYSLHLGCV